MSDATTATGFEHVTLKSPLASAMDTQWSDFVRAMIVAPFDHVHVEANALGAFRMMPRRLADLGLVRGLKQKQSAAGKTIWVGNFVAPLTEKFFLAHPGLQYVVFKKSIVAYAEQIASGELKKPEGMSLAGALAICHRGGPKALGGVMLEKTRDFFARAEGIF